MRLIGYIFSLAGILVIASGVKGFNEIFVKFVPFIANVNKLYLMIAGLVLVVIGMVMLRGSGARQAREVPIYHGKNIVGYRRHR